MGKYLIINADDYGMSQEANEAITDLLANKKISSTSMMANGCFFEEACGLAKKHDLKDIGAHLALTQDNFKVEKPLRYTSLTGAASITPNGFLCSSRQELAERALFKELVCECNKQYHKLLENDIDFTHIDNHMYTLFPGLGLKGYLAALIAYDRTCSAHSRGIRFAKQSMILDGFYEVWSGRKMKTLLLPFIKARGLKPIDRVYAFPYSGKNIETLDDALNTFERFLQNLSDGVTELHIHPCAESASFQQWNPTWKHRVLEYKMLESPNVKELMEKYQVTMISYQDLCQK